MKCPRCGEMFTLYHIEQRRCRRCDAEVQRLIEADTARRTPRFPVAKSFDPCARVGRVA